MDFLGGFESLSHSWSSRQGGSLFLFSCEPDSGALFWPRLLVASALGNQLSFVSW